MQTGDDGALARLMIRWVMFVARHPRKVLGATLALTAIACFFGLGRLGVDTDNSKMIKMADVYQAENRRDRKEFPQYENNLIVIVDAATPETVDMATKGMVARLRQDTSLFADVFAPSDDDYFQKHGLLYKSLDEVEATADQIAAAQPFLGRLTRDPSLHGLFGILSEAADASAEGRSVELGEGLSHVAEVVKAHSEGRRLKMSWSQIMSGEKSSPESLRRVIMARPKIEFDQLLPSGPAIKKIHEIGDELKAQFGPDVRARVTGELALNYEEMRSLKEDTNLAMVLSALLVFSALYHAFRSIRVTLYSWLSLSIGLALTAAFGGIFIGHLNMISVAFAVLYIGLGDNFSTHLLLSYMDFSRSMEPTEALKAATRDTGVSLLLCALTTSIGFLSFWPTAYAGVSELGIISGFGMLVSFIGPTLTILPAFIIMGPPAPTPNKPWLQGVRTWFAHAPRRHGRLIRFGAMAAVAVSLIFVPRAAFDYNPVNLRDPHTESVSTIQELMDSAEAPMWPATTLADNEAEAKRLIAAFEKRPAVGRVLSVFSFTPQDQEDKLAILEDVRLMLGPEVLNPGEPAIQVSDDDRLVSMRRAQEKLGAYAKTAPNPVDRGAAETLTSALEELLARLTAADPQARSSALAELESDLVGTLSVALDQMRKALAAAQVSQADLPTPMRDRWLSASGVYRIEAQPKVNPDTPEQLKAFVSEIRAVAPLAIGEAVNRYEMGRSVIGAFQQAFVFAFVSIFIILFIIMRSLKDTIYALCPLALAGLFTGAASAALNIPFNFANVITLPLLLGMGVDNGIHIVHRFRTGMIEEGSVLASSAAKGVVYSTLTTIFSFASLGMVHHRGVASMGKILTLGLLFSLTCSLMILPALLHRQKRPSENPS